MPTVELATFFLILNVPKEIHVGEIRKVLDRRSFQKRLHKVVEELLQQYPALKPLSFTISR